MNNTASQTASEEMPMLFNQKAKDLLAKEVAFLKDLGLSEDRIENILTDMSLSATDRMHLKINEVMTEEDLINIENAFASGLNDLQKGLLISTMFTQKTGVQFDVALANCIHEEIELFQKEAVLLFLSEDGIVAQIPEEVCDTISSYIDQQNWDQAFTLMSQELIKSKNEAFINKIGSQN